MAYVRADASPNEVLQEQVDAPEQLLSSSCANDGVALTDTRPTCVDTARGVTVEPAGGTQVRADLVVRVGPGRRPPLWRRSPRSAATHPGRAALGLRLRETREPLADPTPADGARRRPPEQAGDGSDDHHAEAVAPLQPGPHPTGPESSKKCGHDGPHHDPLRTGDAVGPEPMTTSSPTGIRTE